MNKLYSQDGFMMRVLSILLLALAFMGCKNDVNDNINFAYIGGEIINPNNNYIVLSRHEEIIDTILLDSKNRFSYKIENLEEGFYNFNHYGEYQIILVEAQDSILFRLNTLEFDESLVFTGNGAKKNNYFINDYLENEREQKYVIKSCQLDPKVYEKRLDSIKNVKLARLEDFESKYDSSTLFDETARASIQYNYYANKEVYPFVHYGKDKAENLKLLPDNFYNYRKDVDYNNIAFIEDHSYRKFLRNSISNQTLKINLKRADNDTFKRSSFTYNLDRLHLIDSLITNPIIKEDMLHHYTKKYLGRSTNVTHNDSIFKSYLAKSPNRKGEEMMRVLISSAIQLQHGANLPAVEVVDYDNKSHNLYNVLKKKSVITFWNHAYYTHFNDSHDKIKELKVKYPEVDFIVVNIDDHPVEKTRSMLLSHNHKLNNQYKLKNPEDAKNSLLIYPLTKTILVDSNKKIVNSYSNIFSFKFEEQVLGLINQ